MSSSNLLEPLVSVIETIKQRIYDHGDEYTNRETFTRMSLIDPVLSALGWIVSDPSLVRPEFTVKNLRPDYVLFRITGKGNERDILATVEAKALNIDVLNVEGQTLQQVLQADVRHAVLTNGDRWLVYDVTRPTMAERRIVDVQLSKVTAAQAALRLLALWRPNLASGAPVEAQHPIVGLADDHLREPDAPQSPPRTIGAEAQSSDVDRRWTPLPDIRADRENPPRLIRFEDATEVSISSFYSIVVETAKWLAMKGALRPESLPLRNPGGGTIANSNPQRANGTPMLRPKDVGTTGIFVETNLNGQSSVRNTVDMLNAVGKDPRAILVCLVN